VIVVEQDQPGEARRPRGMFSSRVDEKGRLKLPEDIRRYLNETGPNEFFVTSFDGRTALIYPIPLWEEAERLLESPGPHARAGKALWFKAQKYGGDAQIDGQGRLLMPPALRREMNVENQAVQMAFFRGHLEVYSLQEFEAQDQVAGENTEQMLEEFVNLGLR
jgi:MraZ protein